MLTTATNPYVDADEAERVVGAPAFRAAGEVAERRALIHVGTDERGGARGFDGR